MTTPPPHGPPADEPRPDPPASVQLRKVKLKLPIGHLLRLQRVRLLRQTSISEVLAEALDHYFASSARDALDAIRAPTVAAQAHAQPA